MLCLTMISVFQKENQVTNYFYFGELLVLRLGSLLRIWSMKMKPGDLDDFNNGGNVIFDIEEPLGATFTHQLCIVSQWHATHEQMGWMSG